jgi:hypothetical protein
MMLKIVPITRTQAGEFIKDYHRHHCPPQGFKQAIGLIDLARDGAPLVGVATAGRPVARELDDGFTLEVTRTCTDGTRNANSMLYGAMRRYAKAVGYERLITYTIPEESGASLRAAGFVPVSEVRGQSWDRPSAGRVRQDKHRIQSRIRWEINFGRHVDEVQKKPAPAAEGSPESLLEAGVAGKRSPV